MLEFLKTHPNIDKVYVCKNGDYFLKPREGAELVTREAALKGKKTTPKPKADDPKVDNEPKVDENEGNEDNENIPQEGE